MAKQKSGAAASQPRAKRANVSKPLAVGDRVRASDGTLTEIFGTARGPEGETVQIGSLSGPWVSATTVERE